MIETRTTWEDSGYDCQHCGVKIFKRIDYESGRSPRTCYQGERGCQWSEDGRFLRVGSHPNCRKLHRQGVLEEPKPTRIPNWVWGIALTLFLLLVIRFGGLVALRLLVPLALAALVLTGAYRFGRERQWW